MLEIGSRLRVAYRGDGVPVYRPLKTSPAARRTAAMSDVCRTEDYAGRSRVTTNVDSPGCMGWFKNIYNTFIRHTGSKKKMKKYSEYKKDRQQN